MWFPRLLIEVNEEITRKVPNLLATLLEDSIRAPNPLTLLPPRLTTPTPMTAEREHPMLNSQTNILSAAQDAGKLRATRIDSVPNPSVLADST